jgi:predicted GH43/DUF377 family glycosyl hydrolase
MFLVGCLLYHHTQIKTEVLLDTRFSAWIIIDPDGSVNISDTENRPCYTITPNSWNHLSDQARLCHRKAVEHFSDKNPRLVFLIGNSTLSEGVIPSLPTPAAKILFRVNGKESTITNFVTLENCTYQGTSTLEIITTSETTPLKLTINQPEYTKEQLSALEYHYRLLNDKTSFLDLAEWYRELEFKDLAFEFYQKAEKLGSEDQKFISQIRLAEIDLYKGNETKASDDLVASYYASQETRAEGLAILCSYYRNNSKHALAYFFGELVRKTPIPERGFMLDREMYEFSTLFDLSISGWYLPGKKEAAKLHCERLLNIQLPWWMARRSLQNYRFYWSSLRELVHPLREITLYDKIPVPIKANNGADFHPCNPCCFIWNNNLYVNIRFVNYYLTKYCYHRIDPAVRKIITKNVLIEITEDLQIDYSRQIILDDSPIREVLMKGTPKEEVYGFEDIRAFSTLIGDSMIFTGTTFELDTNSSCQIASLKISKDGIINSTVLLKSPEKRYCEKNWLPFIMKEEMYLIYNYNPFTVFKFNPETAEMSFCHRSRLPIYNKLFRGGGAVYLPKHRLILVIVHAATDEEDGRVYYHRLLAFDETFTLKATSNYFYFTRPGVEFCPSICVKDDLIIFSYGVQDRTAKLEFYQVDQVLSLLRLVSD